MPTIPSSTSATFSTVISEDLSTKINQPNDWLNGFALVYVVGGYGLAVVGITQAALWANLLGVALLTHTLVWAAYFSHEFMHGAIFRRPRSNALGGKLMLFLTGSCYCRYRALARYHLAHHKNKADFSPFSLSDFLSLQPAWIKQLIIALEWLYFPAVNFMLRWFCMLDPFLGSTRKQDRWRNGGLMLVRGGFFTALGWYSARSLILYLFAYVCFINILRFIDCFQHTFEVFQLGKPIPKFSLEYEEANTYSNIFPGTWPWLNLLLLNFGYHNAHHRVIYCPWYLLPQLDAELYEPNDRCVVTLNRLVSLYHQYRTKRIFSGEGHVLETDEGLDLSGFYGAIGVSFLVLRDPLDWLKLDNAAAETDPAIALP